MQDDDEEEEEEEEEDKEPAVEEVLGRGQRTALLANRTRVSG